MDQQRLAYLALTQVPGMGPARLERLLTACHTPLGAHSAPFAFLRDLPGIGRACATAIKETPLDLGHQLVERAARLGARILVPEDDDFPALLRTVPSPPPVLFAQGRVAVLDPPAIAIVGSRDHSSYGAAVASAAAAQAAGAGIVVVSGMARGSTRWPMPPHSTPAAPRSGSSATGWAWSTRPPTGRCTCGSRRKGYC